MFRRNVQRRPVVRHILRLAGGLLMGWVAVACLTPSRQSDAVSQLVDVEPDAVEKATPAPLSARPAADGARRLPELQPRLGEPLAGLTPFQLARFYDGKAAFGRVFQPEDGLGPIHNMHSCIACHSNPIGGSGTSSITMFGRNREEGFDPLSHLGGPILQSEFIDEACAEVIPEEANVVSHRITSSVLGGGLIEAVADAALVELAAQRRGTVRGRVHHVRALEDASDAPPRVGRFGFKSQMPTVLSFSASAALNEQGLTNRLMPTEAAPNGDVARVALCDDVPDPELVPDEQGVDFLDRVTDFQRFLAAPPQTPRSGMRGEAVFQSIGCADCHVPALVTSDAAGLEEALRGRTIKPYADFLLHDMGDSADGIGQGDAAAHEMRTTPLWGFRIRFPVFHDGRVSAAATADRAARCIELHGGTAAPSVSAYRALGADDRAALFRFLDSLGRVEFDHDGDNDVDLADVRFFHGCLSPVGSSRHTPDDRCAIADVDADGDVTLVDYALLQRAFTGNLPNSTLVVP